MKRALHNQGFFEYETNNIVNNVPKGSTIITIKSAISIFYEKPSTKRKAKIHRGNTSMAIERYDKSMKFDRNHPDIVAIDRFKRP